MVVEKILHIYNKQYLQKKKYCELRRNAAPLKLAALGICIGFLGLNPALVMGAVITHAARRTGAEGGSSFTRCRVSCSL